MCGIYGVLGPDSEKIENNIRALETLNHRGPDAGDYFFDKNRRLFFGHKRLSIIDLSVLGKQPMLSSCERYLISFNGEIYNHKKLLAKLKSSNPNLKMRGGSDTEVLLECISLFGLDETLNMSRGMFAAAIYDFQSSSLKLFRDPLGEKPLYYYKQENNLIFASELKAISKNYNARLNISSSAINWFFAQSCIPAPLTIYDEVKKVLPGEIITFELNKQLSSKFFWNLNDIVGSSNISMQSDNLDAYVNKANQLIDLSVSEQMVADVKVGAFLSGGIDSSVIVSSMQKQSDIPIETFSMGFGKNDELDQAGMIAKHLGTQHHELICTKDDIIDQVENLSKIYCEPFADSSQLPTYLLSKLTKKHVTVALSGDGGDELFGGYNRYIAAESQLKNLFSYPLSIRKPIKKILNLLPSSSIDQLLSSINLIIPKQYQLSDYGQKFQKIIRVLDSSSHSDFYSKLVKKWELHPIISNDYLYQDNLIEFDEPMNDFIANMMFNDIKNYLTNDILVKVDRASMANSLETRVPFLDKRIVEFSQSVPSKFKVNNGVSKIILREIFKRNLPKKYLEQPKTGFGIPIGGWMRNELRDWSEEALSETNLKQSGYLNVKGIRGIFKSHIKGEKNFEHLLWDVIMFQKWFLSSRVS